MSGRWSGSMDAAGCAAASAAHDATAAVKPKRPPHAYDLWSQASKERFRADYPDADSTYLRRIMNSHWKEVSAEERAPFDDQASTLKLEYEQRLRAYNVSVGIAVSDEAATGADGDEDPLPPKPDRPLNPFERWRRLNREQLREAYPTLGPEKFRRKLNNVWHENTPERAAERKTLEDAYAADRERYNAELAAWEAEVERRHPQPEASADSGAAADGVDATSGGELGVNGAPKKPPPALLLWSNASKERFRAENPDADSLQLRNIMNSYWREVSAEERAPFDEQVCGARWGGEAMIAHCSHTRACPQPIRRTR